jgi:hypothetical protein
MKRNLIFVCCFLLLSVQYIFACSGSCLKCHEKLNLEQPKQHKIIKSCIECHGNGCGEDSFLKDKSSETSCGSDCFDCHDSLPNDNNHDKIVECIECHDKLSVIK